MRRQFDFIGRTRIWLIITGVVVVVAVFALVLNGLNLSIDFIGGSSFTVSGTATDVQAGELEDAAVGAGAATASAQIVREGGEATGAIVRTDAIDPGSELEGAVADALQEAASAQNVEVAFVGPTWGDRISRKMLEALVVFLVVVVGYITVRLEFKMAVVALVALVHDLLLTAGIYAIFGFNVSPATVIALLTILGYSLYDTAIVFDRVHETTARLGGPGRRTYSEAVNSAMNDVLQRSLNTSVTSLLPVGALIVIGSRALGATTLEDLAIALFIGMAAGVYSSLFIAGPLLATWREREPKMAQLAQRAQRIGDEPDEAASRPARPQAPTEERLSPGGHVRGRGRKPRSKR